MTNRVSFEARAALADLIEREGLSVVFQPIVELATAEIAGYEALTRPEKSFGFAHAGELFAAAERTGMYEALESLARRKTREAASRWRGSSLLFLNISPPVFCGEQFADVIRSEFPSDGAVPPHRLVLEITERTEEQAGASMISRALDLRESGFSVALDDVGAGISGLNQIMSLRPNWMKLDISLVSEIDIDPLKQNLIRFFVHFAKLGNMRVVAEGIERVEQLRVLIDLGVSHGQGFYLARPGEIGAGLEPHVRDRMQDLRRQSESRTHEDAGSVRVTMLASAPATCEQSDTLAVIGARMDLSLRLDGMIVLDGRRYIGWAGRNEIEKWLLKYDNNERIGSMTLADAALVGPSLTLADGLELVASRPPERQSLPLIVQQQGEITGVVPLRSLLMAAAKTHRRSSSTIAPLTGLPSRVQADRWITNHIKAADPSMLVFVDIREFDAYNAAYGHEKGDQMLMRLVGLIKSRLVEVDDGAKFFAHLGEDRFMLVFRPNASPQLRELVDGFEDLQSEFFSTVDLASRCYRRSDAIDDTQVLPLSSLRVIQLPQILQFVVGPRDLHVLVRRLGLRSFDDTPESRREIILDRRAVEHGRRKMFG